MKTINPFLVDGDYVIGVFSVPYNHPKMCTVPKRSIKKTPQCIAYPGVVLIGVMPPTSALHSMITFGHELKKLENTIDNKLELDTKSVLRLNFSAGNNPFAVITHDRIFISEPVTDRVFTATIDSVFSPYVTFKGKYLAYKRLYQDKRLAGQATFRDVVGEDYIFEADISKGKILDV